MSLRHCRTFRSIRPTTLAGLTLALGLTAAAPARAQLNPYGAFTTEIGVEVLPFHGIEPTVGLSYNSQTGNGVVGVGWHLQATSTIVRGSSGGGVPKYDASDVFFLDGQELVPCAGGSRSPSCSTAVAVFGTRQNFYSTLVDDFRRIRRDPSTDKWTVWRQDGTISTYASQPVSNQLGTWRWALAEVKDTHQNKVTYSYWCDSITERGVSLRRER